MLPECHHVLVAAYVKTVMQLPSRCYKRNNRQDRVASSFPAGVNQQDVWWLTGSSQAPLSNGDEEESDEVEEWDFESRGMLFRDRAQDLEKKMDRAVKGQEEDSSEDDDNPESDSDDGWGDWVDEGEEPGEAIAKKKCMSRAVQLFLHCSHFCHCMAVR